MEASDLLRADDLFARSSKLAGQPQMVEIFQAIGLGQWFRYVTGVIEAGSADAVARVLRRDCARGRWSAPSSRICS
jgi:hypothetical protein